MSPERTSTEQAQLCCAPETSGCTDGIMDGIPIRQVSITKRTESHAATAEFSGFDLGPRNATCLHCAGRMLKVRACTSRMVGAALLVIACGSLIMLMTPLLSPWNSCGAANCPCFSAPQAPQPRTRCIEIIGALFLKCASADQRIAVLHAPSYVGCGT